MESDEAANAVRKRSFEVLPPRRYRPGAGQVTGADCFGDDVGVAGVGVGVARVKMRDAAHRQPRQVGHVDAQRPGCGHGQHPTAFFQPLADLVDPGRGLRQRLVVHLSSCGVQYAGGVLFLADFQIEEHGPGSNHGLASGLYLPATSLAKDVGTHVTKDLSTPVGAWRPCPYQRSSNATKAGDNIPDYRSDRGVESCRHWRPEPLV